MSTHNIHLHDKIGETPKISLDICFLELFIEFPRDSKTSSNMVNESLVFELLKFYCIFCFFMQFLAE